MKTVRTTLLAAAAATFALGATFAYAQESGPKIFEQWDADKDGTITLAEVETRRGDIFTSFDANNDGFLVEEETKLMDEMRDNQQEMNQEEGDMQGMGQGQGQAWAWASTRAWALAWAKAKAWVSTRAWAKVRDRAPMATPAMDRMATWALTPTRTARFPRLNSSASRGIGSANSTAMATAMSTRQTSASETFRIAMQPAPGCFWLPGPSAIQSP